MDAQGQVTRGVGVPTSIREDGVGYSVQFDEDVSGWAWMATIESTETHLTPPGLPLFISVRLLGDGSDEERRTLYVTICDLDRNFVHVPFHVMAIRPHRSPRPAVPGGGEVVEQ